MASCKEYIEFVLDQCSGLSACAMMGEYVLYYGGKVVGGVYDNRLLVKPTPSERRLCQKQSINSPTREQRKCCSLRILKTEIF